MTQPTNREELKMALLAKIHRLQRQGKNADGQINELAAMMTAEQNRLLRTKSNDRFGRKKARQLRKQGGELAFTQVK